MLTEGVLLAGGLTAMPHAVCVSTTGTFQNSTKASKPVLYSSALPPSSMQLMGVCLKAPYHGVPFLEGI